MWLRPEAIAQIEFLECTAGDRLRHSKFAGLREDKDPRSVVKQGDSGRFKKYMTQRTGTLISLLAGGFFGVVASFVPMIFGPLLFPQAISGPTLGENIVVWSIPAFFFMFGAIGFFIARKLVIRFIDHDFPDTNRTFTKMR